MTYRLHCFAESGNTYKVALYLNCAGLDWEPVRVDYFNGETRGTDWRENNNTMGEAPVLEVDGERLTQSGAILTYLADTTGHFAGKDEKARYEILRWILYDNHKFTSYFATHRWLYSMSPEPTDPAIMKFLKDRADASLNVVNHHLASNKYIVGEQPTIADFSMAGYMFFPKEQHGYDFAESYPQIHDWIERLKKINGWLSPSDLLPQAG